MSKRSKLEAYRLTLLVECLWSLVIRYDGDKQQIQQELDRIWIDVQKIDRLPNSCSTLQKMNKRIEEHSSFLTPYI